jgi:hypothetical protein
LPVLSKIDMTTRRARGRAPAGMAADVLRERSDRIVPTTLPKAGWYRHPRCGDDAPAVRSAGIGERTDPGRTQ